MLRLLIPQFLRDVCRMLNIPSAKLSVPKSIAGEHTHAGRRLRFGIKSISTEFVMVFYYLHTI